MECLYAKACDINCTCFPDLRVGLLKQTVVNTASALVTSFGYSLTLKPQLAPALRSTAPLWCNSLDGRRGTSNWSPCSLRSTCISTSGREKPHLDFINDFQVLVVREGTEKERNDRKKNEGREIWEEIGRWEAVCSAPSQQESIFAGTEKLPTEK